MGCSSRTMPETATTMKPGVQVDMHQFVREFDGVRFDNTLFYANRVAASDQLTHELWSY